MTHQFYQRKYFFMFSVLIAVAGWLFVIYQPALNGPFLLDDHANIPQTKIANLTFENAIRIAVTNNSGLFGRPIPVLTFMFNHVLSDGESFTFKLTNWIVHLVIGMLLYVFLRMLLMALCVQRKINFAGNEIRLIAGLATFLWLVHPLQVSTVMYVVQRMTQLTVLFTLLALISYVYGRETLKQSEKGLIFMVIGVGIFGVLACLSKENGALVVAYIILIEWVIYGYKIEKPGQQKYLIIYHLIFVLVPVILAGAYLVLKIDLDYIFNIGETNQFTLHERLLTEPGVILMYLKMMLFPQIEKMGLYYDSYPITREANSVFTYSVLILFLLLAALIMSVRKYPIVSLGIGIFLISHIMESTVLPLELVFEHRNYLALAGVTLVVVWGGFILFRKVRSQTACLITVAIFILTLSFQTYGRSTVWGNELLFNALSVENRPASTRARTWLAVSLVNSGRFDAAVEQYEYVAKLRPSDSYLPLAILQARCIGGEFRNADYENALYVMEHGYVSFTAATVIGNLIQNNAVGVCQRPNSRDIAALYEKAIASDDVRLPNFAKTVFFGNYATLLKANGQQHLATSVMKNLYIADRGNVELMVRYADLLIESNMLEEAQNIVDELSLTKAVKMGGYSTALDLLRDKILSKSAPINVTTIE